ncbi:hypothetical protein M422DRAFT_29264 [Sphaerobolus stellatus SS14]|nr:hypothetical protein M422DRAFT_29264 [Sphaerobolus stellatus SS14]
MQSLVENPPFFHLASRDPESKSTGSCSGVFHHEIFDKPASAHARWWPCSTESPLRTIAFFIPGNPGLIDFYNPFLSVLHRKFKDQGLAILAHAHLGHSPHLMEPETTKLQHQVEACVEVVDEIMATWPDVKIVLIGHSVGSWISSQVLKERTDHVNAAFLLFPTISNIADTPNGRLLSWLFNPPLAATVSNLSVLIRPFVTPIVSLLYSPWPDHQRRVLSSLLRSTSAIRACLNMAYDEMRTIKAPDDLLLTKQSSKLWLYYAEKDNWVGQEREIIISLLGQDATVRVVHCKHGVPHAFCILHGDLIAEQVSSWLVEGGFVAQETL